MGFAQKISLGSCVTKDGGQYKGEMVAGKPNGKGNALYKNGDTYEGEYVKGKDRDTAYTPSPTEKNMKANGSRTSSTAKECTTS